MVGARRFRDVFIKFAEAALYEKRPKAIFTAIGEPTLPSDSWPSIHDYLGGNAIVPN